MWDKQSMREADLHAVTNLLPPAIAGLSAGGHGGSWRSAAAALSCAVVAEDLSLVSLLPHRRRVRLADRAAWFQTQRHRRRPPKRRRATKKFTSTQSCWFSPAAQWCESSRGDRCLLPGTDGPQTTSDDIRLITRITTASKWRPGLFIFFAATSPPLLTPHLFLLLLLLLRRLWHRLFFCGLRCGQIQRHPWTGGECANTLYFAHSSKTAQLFYF